MKTRIYPLIMFFVLLTSIFCLPAFGGPAGSILGWGYNYYGQATPPTGNNYIAISTGWYHSLALRSDGSIVGWGGNWNGQATPPEGNNFIAISAGGNHSLALRSDGSIVGWGWNGSGEATPPTGNNYIAISAGWAHSLGLKQVCLYVLSGDLNDDCKVDFYDFAMMAGNWLIDCNIEPTNPACIWK
jgi:hypothetical protein